MTRFRSFTATMLIAAMVAGTASARTPTICQGDVCCRGNMCHRFQHLDGSLYSWGQVGAAGVVICAMFGCFPSLNPSSGSGSSQGQQQQWGVPGSAPPRSYNMFEHVAPLPGYGVGR